VCAESGQRYFLDNENVIKEILPQSR